MVDNTGHRCRGVDILEQRLKCYRVLPSGSISLGDIQLLHITETQLLHISEALKRIAIAS